MIFISLSIGEGPKLTTWNVVLRRGGGVSGMDIYFFGTRKFATNALLQCLIKKVLPVTGFDSGRGLRIFLCPKLMSCWLIHLHISLPSLNSPFLLIYQEYNCSAKWFLTNLLHFTLLYSINIDAWKIVIARSIELVILAMWLALSGAIYSRLALSFALNHINENGTVKKIELSCPLGTTRRIPQEKLPRKPCNKSFIDQVCSVKMAEYWPRSFFARLWTSTSSRSLGQ